jgi:hypothetical protein
VGQPDIRIERSNDPGIPKRRRHRRQHRTANPLQFSGILRDGARADLLLAFSSLYSCTHEHLVPRSVCLEL